MKLKEFHTGNKLCYAQFPGIKFNEVGVWTDDLNNVPPCEWTMDNIEYRKWFHSVHPKPVDIRQATRFWLDRREMLCRRQHPTPESYEEFLQIRRWIGPGTKYEDGYDYIAHREDTEDNGSLYRMHMIRQQAAIDLQHSAEDGAYITEQQIDNYLIANHEPDEGEEERTTLAARQKMDATMEKIRASYARKGSTYVPPRPRTPVPVYTPEHHDWDFFYRSLQAPPDIRTTILAKMCSGSNATLMPSSTPEPR